MNEHEVYPSAPVVLVALEVKHPPTDPLTRSERNLIKKEIATRTPIMKSAQAWGFQLGLGPGAAAPQAVHEEYPKFFDRRSTVAVSYQSEGVIVETTKYVGWKDFLDVVKMAVSARDAVAPIDGVARVGLRYINEIRVKEADPDWSRWLRPALLQPDIDKLIQMPLSQWQGVAVYGQQPGRAVSLRYGPREGTTIAQPSELKISYGGPYNQFFLLDIDSFTVPETGTPAYVVDELLSTCEELHVPVQALFDGLVTDKLRDEVFRNVNNDQ